MTKSLQDLEIELMNLQVELSAKKKEIESFNTRPRVNFRSKESIERLDMLRPYLMKNIMEIWRYNHEEISDCDDWWDAIKLSDTCTAQLYLTEYFGTDTWDVNFYRNEDESETQQISVYPVFNGVTDNSWECCIRI